jgi:iron complex outermembrane receptor protein
MTKSLFHSTTCVAAAVAAVLAASAVQAAESAPTAGVNDIAEIIVTARQRAEKLLDVPVAVQAFTASDIKAAGIERPQDFIALTPGVSQVQTAEVGDMQVSIRGLNTGRDAETNFALVVDGVLQTNPNGFNQEFANIQQIEILKGPQGALYGRNAVAGAMIITSRKPTDQFEADATVGFGNHNTSKANFYVAGALADGVDAGLSGFYRKTDGFFTNSLYDCKGCVDYYKETGVAPRMIFKAGDTGTIDVKAKYSKITAGAINFNAVFALPFFATAFGNPDFWQNVNEHPFKYINNIIPENEQKNLQFSVKGDWKLDVGTLTAWAAYNDQKNSFLTDGTSAAFNLYNNVPTSAGSNVCSVSVAAEPGGPLPSPTFYANQFGPGIPGFNLLPAYSPTTCDGYQYQQRDQKDASFEVRLSSPDGQALRWQGGVYYGDIKRHVVVAQGSDLGNGFLKQAFVPSTGPNPTDLLYDDDFHSKVAAAFGQLAYDVAPGLEVALALRYDNEKRSVSNNVGTGANALAQTPCFAQGPTCPGQPYINPAYAVDPTLATTGIPGRDQTFSQLQPKLSVNWKPTDGVSVFASYGYGFRSGGFNSTGSAATVLQYFGGLHEVVGGTPTTTPSLPVASLGTCAGGGNNAVVYDASGVGTATCGGTPTYGNGVSDNYKKEVSKAAELGFKSELLDRHLMINASVYQTKIENMQIFNFFAGPFGLLRVVTNVDNATIKGVEGDIRWRANRYVTLFAGFGTVDSKIDSYSGRPYTAGNAVPYAPKYTGDAGVDFNIPISSAVSMTARVDMNAIGKTWFSAVQNNSVQSVFGVPADYSKTYRDAYETVNARIGFHGEHWDATAWGRNLANKQYLAEVIPAPEFGGSFIHQAPGRAFGLDFTFRFGGGAESAPTKPAAPAAPVAPPAPVAAPAPAPASAPAAAPPAPKPAPPPPAAPAAPAHEVVLKGVQFETASAKLKPASVAVLDSAVANIKKCECGGVAIRGYTDSVGNADYNKKLSERRAQAVKDYLVAHGIAAGMVSAEGFGEENPIADNKTVTGRTENRRVTIEFKAVAGH